MEYNICPQCNTKNESEYIYCKNCGAQLKNVNYKRRNAPSQDESYNENKAYNARSFGGNAVVTDTIGGIPYSEMAVFVGKKAYQIMPKFCKMEMTGSKISWCWPAAILSFIFGPLGAALWFFYRKMYKIAAVFVAVGIIMSCAFSVATLPFYNMQLDKYSNEDIDLQEASDDVLDIFGQIYDNLDYRFYIAVISEHFLNIATFLLSGLFGYYFYMRYAVKRILQYRTSAVDARYYKFGLASIGGTSGVMLLLGILIMFFSENIIQLIINIV